MNDNATFLQQVAKLDPTYKFAAAATTIEGFGAATAQVREAAAKIIQPEPSLNESIRTTGGLLAQSLITGVAGAVVTGNPFIGGGLAIAHALIKTTNGKSGGIV